MTSITTSHDINIIDIISSGLSNQSFPLEVSVLLGNGQRYHSFVKPTDKWLNTRSTEEKENISALDLNKLISKGKSPRRICDDLLLFCGQLDMYSDSSIMDNYWLEKLFSVANTTHRITCKSIEELIGEAQISAWQDKKTFVNDLFDHSEYSAVDQSNTIHVALGIFFSDQVYNLNDQSLPLIDVAVI